MLDKSEHGVKIWVNLSKISTKIIEITRVG
jgi:hypothetical protein